MKTANDTNQPASERSCPDPAGSRFDTPETDILHDHCHIDNTPAPEAIETWVDKCKKLERERNALKSALHRLDRPDHPRADEIHPLTRLPKGFRWMEDRETIQPGCKYVKLGSPKWHDVTKAGDEYSVLGYHPMAAPIHFENRD